MRRTLTAGIACLTLALAPLEPVHASGAGPRPSNAAALALLGLLGIAVGPVRDERRPGGGAILPRLGVGRIDRNTVDRRPDRPRRHVNNRRERHSPPRHPPGPATFFAWRSHPALGDPAPQQHQGRTVVQR